MSYLGTTYGCPATRKIVGAVWAPTAGRFVGIGERVSLGHSGHGQIVSIATDLRNISVDEIPT